MTNSETSPEPTEPSPAGGAKARATVSKGLRLAVWACCAVGGAGLLYVMGGAFFKPGSEPGPGYVQAKGPAGVSFLKVDQAQAAAMPETLHAIPPLLPRGQGEPAPDIAFADAAGKPVKLTDFKGKVVVVNFWATWCAPCRQEMPTLAKLAAAMAGKPVRIVALSVDNAKGTDKAKAFIAQNAPLAFYQDASMTLPFKMKPVVEAFPTTIIYDKSGRARAVAKSDLDWSGDRARSVIGKLAAE